jgi:hypothetical protein
VARCQDSGDDPMHPHLSPANTAPVAGRARWVQVLDRHAILVVVYSNLQSPYPPISLVME